MDNLLRYWESQLYTQIVTYLLAGIGFFISLRGNRRNPKLKPLSFFFLVYFLDTSIVFCIVATKYDAHIKDWVTTYSDFIDTIIEFLAFFFLIKNHVTDVKLKKALNPLLPVFLSSALFYFVYYKSTHTKIDQYFLQIIFTMQAAILIVACILYYADLFKKEPKSNLTVQPSFWAVTGLAFFMLCTLPFSILGLYLINADYMLYAQLFSIFEIFYWILFSMIIKAYLCKPTLA